MLERWKKVLNAECYQREQNENVEKNYNTVKKVSMIYAILVLATIVIMHFAYWDSKIDTLYVSFFLLQVIISIIMVYLIKRSPIREKYYLCKLYRLFCISFVMVISVYPYAERPANYFPAVLLFCSIILIYPLYDEILTATGYEIFYIVLIIVCKHPYPNVMQDDLIASFAGYVVTLISLAIMNRLRMEEYEAGQVKEIFLARMSHDIRTPLNAVLGLTTLALEECDDKEQINDYLKKIDASGQYLLSLVDETLDMVKLSNVGFTFYNEVYSQKEFLETMNAIFNSTCKQKKITFQVNEAENMEDIVVDKLRFNQIFFNLISNAIKFTPSGGIVHFQIIKQEKIPEGKEKVRFVIEDNGCGMSEDFMIHMFDTFSQEHTTENHKMQGTGLGLSIVKQLVDKMDGEILVESKVGVGTRFEVILPLIISEEGEKEEEELAVGADVPPSDFLQGKRVLVVEDNAINAEIVIRIISKKGMIVNYAENGQIAVERFLESQEGYYDVILMDIRMPVMDGLEASRQIRDSKRMDANLPIIVLSANTFEEDKQRSEAVGINKHLEKPIQPKKMLDTIEEQIFLYQK